MTSSHLILNATGGIGRGVVEAALDAGCAVVAVADDAEGLRALHERHPGADLLTLAAPIASDADAARLAERLRATDRIFAGAIAAIGGTHCAGRLLDQPADVLQRTLDEDLLPHLFAARHLFPLLPHDGATTAYVLIGGPGGEHPWSGYGHCSIATAALRMMARVLHDEAGREGLRVQLLSVPVPVCTDINRDQACPDWPKAVAVGRRALALLDGGRNVATPIVNFEVVPRLTSSVIEVATSAPTISRRRRTPAATTASVAPDRDLDDARALLDSLASPPLSGVPHDEHS